MGSLNNNWRSANECIIYYLGAREEELSQKYMIKQVKTEYNESAEGEKPRNDVLINSGPSQSPFRRE